MSERGMAKRPQWATYMNTGTEAAPVWTRLGEGFTVVRKNMNATKYRRKYVHEATERCDVVGYATSIVYECDVYGGDPVLARLGEVCDKELIGSDALVELVDVNLYEQRAGGYAATKRMWSVIPDTKGSDEETLTLTGEFAAVGDLRTGSFSEDGGFVGD